MLLTLLASTAAVSGFWAIWWLRVYFRHKRELRSRIRELADWEQPGETMILQLAARFDQSVAGSRLGKQLQECYLHMLPSEYAAYSILFHVLLVLCLNSVVGLPFYASLLLAGFGLEIAKRVFFAARRRKHIELFNRQLPAVCRMLCNSLRAGLSLVQAVEFLAKELPMPAQREFLVIHKELALGGEFEQVLNDFKQRNKSKDCDLFAGVVAIQRKTGGNLPLALENMAKALEERALLQETITTMTAEATYISYILPLIPIILLIMMNSMIDGFLLPLLSPPGLFLLGFFISVQVVAFWAVRKLTRVKV